MPLAYHANVTTDVPIRPDFPKSDMWNADLVRHYGVSENAVSNWWNRKLLEDTVSDPATSGR